MALIVVHYLDNNHVHFDHHLIIGDKQHLIIGSVLWNYQNADYNDSLPMFQFAQSWHVVTMLHDIALLCMAHPLKSSELVTHYHLYRRWGFLFNQVPECGRFSILSILSLNWATLGSHHWSCHMFSLWVMRSLKTLGSLITDVLTLPSPTPPTLTRLFIPFQAIQLGSSPHNNSQWFNLHICYYSGRN